jgi:hypothetical protein
MARATRISARYKEAHSQRSFAFVEIVPHGSCEPVSRACDSSSHRSGRTKKGRSRGSVCWGKPHFVDRLVVFCGRSGFVGGFWVRGLSALVCNRDVDDERSACDANGSDANLVLFGVEWSSLVNDPEFLDESEYEEVDAELVDFAYWEKLLEVRDTVRELPEAG